MADVYRERVARRLHLLECDYKEMTEKIDCTGLYLNLDVLTHCVEKYFDNIEKLKRITGIAHVDQHKRAAYTIKWIVKFRPIQFENGISATKQTLLANEIYAIFSGMNHLQSKGISVSKHYFNSLIETLHHSPLVGEVLASKMYLLERALSGKMP